MKYNLNFDSTKEEDMLLWRSMLQAPEMLSLLQEIRDELRRLDKYGTDQFTSISSVRTKFLEMVQEHGVDLDI